MHAQGPMVRCSDRVGKVSWHIRYLRPPRRPYIRTADYWDCAIADDGDTSSVPRPQSSPPDPSPTTSLVAEPKTADREAPLVNANPNLGLIGLGIMGRPMAQDSMGRRQR